MDKVDPTRLSGRGEIRKIIEAMATYDYETNDETGETWCRFCDAYGKNFDWSSPVHAPDCPAVLAKEIRYT